ncbi:hypothetical protein [Caulobacter sp. FWC2]|uniref:hypothetical protein n=1 Tax=Caulobacter sp. FWC2 TaxID=69664 RepID=UPI000C152CE4|nr:hypothetical protein [Caulobacter sp. FWC2]PIB91253.1 hypothetical protein CSW62_06490 [Caulobacter sp. FWC2]
MTDTALDERHAIGANNPPEETPVITPFDAHKANIEDLFLEAKNWVDGTPIESQEQADKVQELLRKTQEAYNAADKSRDEEKRPHDEAAKAVQDKYAPLIADNKSRKGVAVLAIEALRKVGTDWLKKLDAEREAEAQRQRDIAAKAIADAQALINEARDTGDLATREQAEVAIVEAKALDRNATRVENARPQARGYGRAMSLRDNWVITGFVPVPVMDANGQETGGVVEGETALLRHYWTVNKPALVAAALELARQDVLQGKRTLPGVVIINDRKAA